MPLIDLLFTMFWFFLFIAWIWLLISIFGDIFRSDDLSGWGKAFWTLFVLFLPWLGVLVYLIARGGSMQERALKNAAAHQNAQESYIREVASSTGGSSAEELAKLAELRDSGILTEQEFQAQKAKALA